MMIDVIREPAFWMLAAIVTFSIVQLISALALRAARRGMLRAVQAISDERDINASDKAWLRYEIDRSRGAHILLGSFLAPLAFPAAAIFGLYDGWTRRAADGLSLSSTQQQFDEAEQRHINLCEGHDPSKGRYWSDARRKQISSYADTLESWNHPIAYIWIGVWLAAAFPLVLATYWISGSVRPFVDNLWRPLREPVASLIHEARHAFAH